MRVSLYFGPDITGVYPALVAICEPVFVAVSEVGWEHMLTIGDIHSISKLILVDPSGI